MAQFVSIMGMAHAPGITGWINSSPEHERKAIEAGYDELGHVMDKARPDLMIGVANDHMLNLPLKHPPHFCVGTAEEWHGPAEFFKAWLNSPATTCRAMPRLRTRSIARPRPPASASMHAAISCSTTIGRCRSGISATTSRSCRST